MADITMSGWLDKRGGQDASKGWKRRWCIMSDSTLRYYKGETDGSPAGTIFGEDIVDVTEDIEESQKDSAKYGFVFRIITRGRDYLFNTPNGAKRDEWIQRIKALLHAHRSAESQHPDVKYVTIEVFINRGLRVNGDIGPALTSQLNNCGGNAKSHSDEKGWFTDHYIPHANLLNIFTQHGWSLATAFQSNSVPPGSSSSAPSDTLVFTHPNS